MSGFLEKIKLSAFSIMRVPYKKRLFKNSETDVELRFLSTLLGQEQLLFIDVGANRGEFIFIAEKSLVPTKIWAFEPLPYFAKKLKVLFPNVKVFNIGLSDTESKTTLYVPVNNGIPDDSLSSVNKPVGTFNAYDINFTTLDNIIKKEFISREKIFIKIDVEGHEFNVLKGAENTIKDAVIAMLIEIEERHHEDKTLKEMIEDVETRGFTCYHLHPEKPELIAYSTNTNLHQRKEDFNTRRYVNNFWFFSNKMNSLALVNKINSLIN